MVYHLYTIYDTMVHKYNIYTMVQLLKYHILMYPIIMVSQYLNNLKILNVPLLNDNKSC